MIARGGLDELIISTNLVCRKQRVRRPRIPSYILTERRVEELADRLVKQQAESYDILLESANMSSVKREAEER